MSYGNSESPFGDDQEYEDTSMGPSKKSWFASNSSGVGLHPQTWQGVMVLVVAVILVLCIILVLKRL